MPAWRQGQNICSGATDLFMVSEAFQRGLREGPNDCVIYIDHIQGYQKSLLRGL